MASLLKFEQIRDLILHSISTALQVRHVCLVVYVDNKGYFQLFSDDAEVSRKTGQDLFAQGHPIVAFLERTRKPLTKYIVEKNASDPYEAAQIFPVFDLLHASLFP